MTTDKEFEVWAAGIELPEHFYKDGIKIGDTTYNNYRTVWALIHSIIAGKKHLEQEIDRL